MTRITDDNIRDLIEKYINSKNLLPPDLPRNINDWDITRVTDMSELFMNYSNFNEPLNKWTITGVDSMSQMFYGCTSFNQPLDWNVSNVDDMGGMFYGCTKFNQKLNWNVSKVSNMSGMFKGCTDFNQPLNFTITRVDFMSQMFYGCTNFNQPLDWNVSNVNEMNEMFYGCTNFNQPLDWNVSNVGDMEKMFYGCAKFNQPLDWDVSNVGDMKEMFKGCTDFNQPLNWNVSNVTNMSGMFENCTNFNQNLNEWVLDSIEDFSGIFTNCNIDENNKPAFRIDRQRIDPMQIHKESAKINYEKLNALLKEQTGKNIPTNINYPDYINKTILQMIESEEPEDKSKKDGLKRIMDERLNNFDYNSVSPLLRQSIFYTLEFVKNQPAEFKKEYIDTFIKNCVYANEDGMTCGVGALERFAMSLLDPCSFALTMGENEVYAQIIAFIAATPGVLIPIYIQDWYRLHKKGTPGQFPLGTSREVKRANLKAYLLEKFPNERELIDNKIAEIADNTGYDDDDFDVLYGGKKSKKTKKSKKSKKTKKQKSKKTKKNIKTKKSKKNIKTKKNISKKNKSKKNIN
jgi:hypothetical protein